MKVFILFTAACIYSLITPFTGLLHYPIAYCLITILFLLLILTFTRLFVIKSITNHEQSKLTNVINNTNSLISQIFLLAEYNKIIQHKIAELDHQLSEYKKLKKADLISHNEKQERVIHYDKLTSLPTRIFFNESLNKAIISSKRRNKTLAVMIINFDFFKDENPRSEVDKNTNAVIKEISSRLSTTLRAEDLLAKLEGEEFAILLNDIGKPKFASIVAEKLLKACGQSVTVNSVEFKLSTSIGISIYPEDGSSLEAMLTAANSAVEAVKHSGASGYQFYTNAIDVEAHEYVQLDAALRKAIENNELSLHYQPRLHIKRGHITGVEALLRWSHKQFGNIKPSVFIPLAEETNLIIPLGEWALTEACKANKKWQEEGYEHMTISLNLSAKQFYHPDICNMITRVLEKTGLSPNYLEFEITETTVMNDIAKSKDILDKFKACGVQIAIDHFGMGYTSISHLKLFPINTIKIDQGFIKGIPNNPNDLSIVNAFIALAKNLGLLVVAEGVETSEQVEYLANQSCDLVQGYYLSQPVSEDKITPQFKKIMDDVLVML